MFTCSLVEIPVVQPASTSPARICVSEHQVVTVHDMVVRDVKSRSVAKNGGLFVNQFSDDRRRTEYDGRP